MKRGFDHHVFPPQVDKYGLGFRVPALLISSYARYNYVSYTPYDFSSFLAFNPNSPPQRSTSTVAAVSSSALPREILTTPLQMIAGSVIALAAVSALIVIGYASVRKT